MNQNVINFYLGANKLKNVIRTGWKEVGISSERIESVADHIYGCLILTIGLDSEYNLGLDIAKVFKMIVVKELRKINIEDETTPGGSSDKDGSDVILKLTDGLVKQSELVSLYNEINERKSKEAIFTNNVTKIESDIQAKIYDLKGQFSLENAIEDVKNYGEELSKQILPQMKNASDGWLLFDRRYYEGNEIFESLSNDIQNIQEL